MNKIVFTLLLFACLFLSSSILHGHSGDEHAKEIGEVFGLCDENGKSRGYAQSRELVKELGDCISKFIDQDTHTVTQTINEQLAKYLCSYGLSQRIFSDYKSRLWKISKRLDKIQRHLKQSSASRYDDKIKEELKNIRSELSFIPGYRTDAENLKFYLEHPRSLVVFLEDLSKKINQDQGHLSLDIVKKRIESLKKEERLFSLGNGQHRVLFHWGIDNSPRIYPPLINCVDASTSMIKKMFRNIKFNEYLALQDIIYQIVMKKWSERKALAQCEFEKILFRYNKVAPSNMKQIEALLSIAYNVHILGDYADTRIEPLASVEDIAESLRKSFESFDANDRTETRKICGAITEACRSSNLKEKSAAAVLSTLKKLLPDYLEHCPRMHALLRGQ